MALGTTQRNLEEWITHVNMELDDLRRAVKAINASVESLERTCKHLLRGIEALDKETQRLDAKKASIFEQLFG